MELKNKLKLKKMGNLDCNYELFSFASHHWLGFLKFERWLDSNDDFNVNPICYIDRSRFFLSFFPSGKH